MSLFKNATLRKNLIMWLIAIVTISTLVFFFIYYNLSEKLIQQAIKDNLVSTSKNKVQFVDNSLDEYTNVVKSLAASKTIQAEAPEDIRHALNSYINIYSNDFSEFGFVNASGKLIYHTKNNTNIDVSDREYFIAAKNKQSYISDAILSRVDGQQVLVISSPILKDNDFKGAVIGIVRLQKMSSLINSESSSLKSQTYLVNHKGEVISKAGLDSNISWIKTGQNIAQISNGIYKNNIEEAMKKGSTIKLYTNHSDKKVLGSFSPFPHKDWVLITEVDISQNISQIRSSSAKAGIFTLLMTIIMFIPFILYLSRKLSTPINNIAQVVQELAAGNFDRRINLKTSNEIGMLAQSFNSMAERLQDTYTELREKITDLNAQREETDLKNLKLEQVVEVNKTILDQLEEKNKQLDLANRLKAEFLANMTHEFRTPMNSIIGYTEMILDGNDGEINDEQRKDLTIILKSSESLLAIINDILDLSKIEAGKMVYKFKKFNPVDEVLTLIENIKIMAQSKGLDLIFEYQSDIPEIYSDPIKLNHVVSNILSNAVKFTDSGHIKVCLTVEDESVINISVADTGIGIPEEEIKNVFDEFRQLDGSSTRKYGGTGLGLTIAKGLLEGLGGDISATSEVGKGSTFTVQIPISKSTAPIAEKRNEDSIKPVALPTMNNNLIVVITRNSSNYNSIENALSRHNFKVISTDYTKALETVKALNPSCIFIDIDLPCTNCNEGWLTLSDLAQDKITSSIPTVVVSTQESSGLSFILGASDYLVKPFGTQEILDILGRCTTKLDRGYVLLIEENKETADLVSKIVRKNTPYNTLLVNSKKDIFNVLESSNPPKMIILNVSLPSIKPIEIINLVNSVDVEKNIPIIAVSEKKLSNLEHEFLRHNTDNILYKPDIRHSKLVTEIKRILAEKMK